MCNSRMLAAGLILPNTSVVVMPVVNYRRAFSKYFLSEYGRNVCNKAIHRFSVFVHGNCGC